MFDIMVLYCESQFLDLCIMILNNLNRSNAIDCLFLCLFSANNLLSLKYMCKSSHNVLHILAIDYKIPGIVETTRGV